MSGEVREQTDLATWLGQCIDDDERVARYAIQETTGRWTDRETDWGRGPVVEDDCGALILPTDRPGNTQYPHIARWDPARVLAECDTKRRIIAECKYWYDKVNRGEKYPALADRFEVAFGILCLLALPYADRDGYRSEWAPDGR